MIALIIRVSFHAPAPVRAGMAAVLPHPVVLPLGEEHPSADRADLLGEGVPLFRFGMALPETAPASVRAEFPRPAAGLLRDGLAAHGTEPLYAAGQELVHIKIVKAVRHHAHLPCGSKTPCFLRKHTKKA